MSIRCDQNLKARAVRLVREHRDDYDSEWAATKAISGRLGMNRRRCASGCARPRSTPVRRRGCRARRSGSRGSYAGRTASWKQTIVILGRTDCSAA